MKYLTILLFFTASLLNAGVVATYTISADTAEGEVDTNKLHQEIADSGAVTAFDGLGTAGDTLTIEGDAIANQATLDSTVNNHVAVTLDEYKQAKRDAILAKTTLLEQDLTFAYGGNTYKLSLSYQAKWAGLVVADLKGLIVFPYDITDIDGLVHELADTTDLANFYGTGLGAAQTFFAGDDQYFTDIDAAADKAAVDAVVDTR